MKPGTLRALTEYSRLWSSPAIPFAPTVIRFDPQTGRPWLMHRAGRGWGEYGLEYRTLWEIARLWRLTFTEFGADAHGRFIAVAPASREKASV